MSGARFVDPPASIYRRRPSADPGLLALAGVVLAVVFLMVLIGMLANSLGVRIELLDLVPTAR